MKLAVAGKGGVGKTSLTAWIGDYLSRQGRDTWLVDADTALSLGSALGLSPQDVPIPLIQDEALIRERVGSGFINLNPQVADLPERLRVRTGGLDLVVMGSVAGAGGGCACEANALLKALLAHLIVERDQWVVVDLEAGVEHLGRGTVSAVDGLVVVSEPSWRSLSVAARIAGMAAELGLTRQALVLNRAENGSTLPDIPGLPPLTAAIPALTGLTERQLTSPSVLDLPERPALDLACAAILAALADQEPQPSR
ncbi:ArsA-related P-loop ATPase [Desulfolutivibrio sulfoxidireducens]|uniref:ATP-binding protein n=1 Tax=Desulfolutivibrio sulfoxidireducens TaxID=2773299 RepID=UPI00159E0101|nr:ArsA-related P-loop ATPase [Desulfolutivibrio sulfoxidireducens]QLA19863.1 carbon monoxide dehydrogenase [Desulfolutivibrio sulfoxidireducens]